MLQKMVLTSQSTGLKRNKSNFYQRLIIQNMNLSGRFFKLLKVSILLFFFVITSSISTGQIKPIEYKGVFISNDEFINGLYFDLNNAELVFSYVFSKLEDEVTIYPTENYYYFTFSAQGKTFCGSIALFASKRDEGILDFGYIEKNDKFSQPDPNAVSGWGVYNAENGVIVKKINNFKYSVTYDNRTIIFNLNKIGLEPPRKANLTDDEIFIGPGFDESGLKFFLIFNESVNHFYWILNEDGFVPEYFSDYTDNIVIGNRTEFAFYLDKENERKILIGVEGYNVLNNNWYDGPFDQMPDNYIKIDSIEVKKYLEAYLPNIKGKIDKFGRYIHEKGTRVAMAPYLVYFSKEDLVDIVSRCKYLSTDSRAEFFKCITQQIYDVPEDVYLRKH